jgi:hypothetical protein
MSLSLTDLFSLGPCIISTLPYNYLKNLDPSVFIKYYPTLGISFQPDLTEINIVSSLI